MTELAPTLMKAAAVLWDFHAVEKSPTGPVDIILALGSHDARVAERAADLWLKQTSPWLVVSGGSGKVTGGIWVKPEAEVFADIAAAKRVPRDHIIVEPEAKNTGENILLSRKATSARSIEVTSSILVTKPYMRRRALATAQKQWEEVEWFVTSPAIGLSDYATPDTPLERMINLMVGDLQRLDVYAEQGFQVPQEIPSEVWAAWRELVDAGFDQFVIR